MAPTTRRCFAALIALLVCVACNAAFAQNPGVPQPRRTARTDDAASQRIQLNKSREESLKRMMRDAELAASESAQPPSTERAVPMSDADRKRIKALLTPDPSDVAANKDLLRRSRTGIFRLYPDASCESGREVRVDGDCANHVPRSSTFSFRSDALTPDIVFNNGLLVGDAFFSQMIMVELGDLPLLDLDKTAEGLKFLEEFVPAKDLAGAGEQYRAIHQGIRVDGRTYSERVLPKLNTTYAMRIIAYRNGNDLLGRSEQGSAIPENMIKGLQTIQQENRMDMLVAFRVVRRGDAADVTIVWKELSRQKSPEINFEKQKKLTDLK
ncbi:MAG TPA: hypothetical protein VGO43_04015 [Pyrinomonadaceae bacterium]|jgi:hypothetical protein|nr:hypothetical protein [Pyrinomonadaceae bacterium]